MRFRRTVMLCCSLCAATLIVTACSGDLDAGSGATVTRQLAIQAAAHDEILRAQPIGTDLYARQLSSVLAAQGVSAFDTQTISASVGNAGTMTYVLGDQISCPFLRPAGQPGVACSALTEQAFQRALVGELAAQQVAVEQRAADLRADLGDDGVQFVALYGKAALENGLVAARVRATQALRSASLCDTTPEPMGDAFVLGGEEGETQFMARSQATLESTPPTVCNVDLIAQAARDATRAGVADYLARTPLCPGVSTQTLSSRVDIVAADAQRRAGIDAGIDAGYDNFRIWLMHNWQCEPPASSPSPTTFGDPIVVDLEGHGLRFDAARVAFDLFDDGRGAWITPPAGGAWLARDLDGDGCVGSGAELVTEAQGDHALDGALDALAAFDADHDGVLDAREIAAAGLGLWRDANRDGACQRGEWTTLAQAGFDRISLAVRDGYRIDASGNVIRGRIELGGARTAAAYDVWLAAETDSPPGGIALMKRPSRL